MTPMTPEVAAKFSSQELIHRATFHLDRQEWADYAACFAPDGVLLRPSDGKRLVGPEAIVEAHRGRPPATTVHIVSNTFFTDVTPTSMTAQSRVVKFGGPAGDGPTNADPTIVVGNYPEKVVLVDGTWLLAERSGDRELMVEWAAPAGE